MRASRSVAVLVIGLGLTTVGCATQDVGHVGSEPREQIAYAATAKYPGTTMHVQTSDRVQVAAVDDVDSHKLTLMNLSDNTIPPSTAWINGAYVRQLATIAPRGMVEINYSDILMAGPNPGDLKQTGQIVRKVELQTQEGLFTVQGPSRKAK